MAFLFVSSSGLYMPSYACMPLSKRQGKAFYQNSPNIHRFSTLLHDTPSRVVSSFPREIITIPRMLLFEPSALCRLQPPITYVTCEKSVCLFLVQCFYRHGEGRGSEDYTFLLRKQKGFQERVLSYFFSLFLFLSSSSIPELDGVNHASRLIPFGVRRRDKARMQRKGHSIVVHRRGDVGSDVKVETCWLHSGIRWDFGHKSK